MRFELKHNNSLAKSISIYSDSQHYIIMKFDYFKSDNRKKQSRSAVKISKSILNDQWFPAEVIDDGMKSMPAEASINYGSLYDLFEKGEIPKDLTPTEIVLTNLLWGDIERNRAILLVSALEDMNIDAVKRNLDNLGMF